MASSPISLLFLLLLSLLPFLPIFSASNITPSSSLSTNGDNSSWISPSGDFAFGFYQLNNTNTFLLAICYPTDTILPTQILRLGGMLCSKFSETNYSKGRFELHFTNGGDLELNLVAWPSDKLYAPYYSSRKANSNSSESGFQLVFNQSADIYIVKVNGGAVPLS
ncbi:hypothetical protein CsSME_00044639 [Camellia sinensis var. sinensis]